MKKNDTSKLFQSMISKWQGTVKTWFQPGELADDSEVTGEVVAVLDGKILRHTYRGSIQNKPRNGEELIAFNTVSKVFEQSWFDSFHMNYGIMFSTGEAIENGFTVKGEYAVGGDNPPWGWQTDYLLIDNDTLLITAYNIPPGGEKEKAVETRYTRIKGSR